MKPYAKRVEESHHYNPKTRREKRGSCPKNSDDRRGTRTAARMAAKRDYLKDQDA